MNFSALSRASVAGRLLRLPLKLVPKTARMPILQGPLRGLRWIAGSSTHGCWLGSYEQNKCLRFAREVRPGSVVYDVGAHVGYYSLLSAVATGPGGRVVAFEPLPANLHFLRQHLAMNDLAQVEVIEAAVSDREGRARFSVNAESSMGSLGQDGELDVRLVALDELIARGEIPPADCLKIDVEGAELEVLRGAETLLAEHRPPLFLATHGAEVHAACMAFLTELGYELHAFGGDDPATTDELLALPGRR